MIEKTDYLFWQTADPVTYRPMLELTGTHNKLYCTNHNIPYDFFVGISRGYWGWQATFNRIIKLNELLESGFKGWFLYADADSYVFDLSFDLKAYLEENKEYLLIAATGGDGRRLAVNAGVFFLNFSDQHAPWLIRRWHELFLSKASDEYLRKHQSWENDGINDQEFLHQCLGERQNELGQYVLVDDGNLINYRGSFLRQVLRTTFRELDERMRAIRIDISLSLQNFADKQASV